MPLDPARDGGFSKLGSVFGILAFVSGALACSSPPDEISDAGPDGRPSAGPYLTSLVVSATDETSAQIPLVPQFSSEIFDYYVRCAAGSNSLSVSMKASPGASSSLIRPTTSASMPEQTLSLSVNENQAIVATATAGAASTEYWVRCLPQDFPAMTMVAHREAGTPPVGYYLVGTASAGLGGYAMVLNGNGVPVWYFKGGPSAGMADVDTIVPGTLSFFLKAGSPAAVHQLSPSKTTYVAPSKTVFDPHELQILPNGNYVGLSNPYETVDLTGLHVPLPDGGTVSPGKNTTIAACNVVEFEPSGKVVWTWLGSEHFDPVKDCTIAQFDLPRLPDGGVVFDTYHCNSIDVDPANGNLLVSSRDMDSIFYIERSTSKILWKMGGTDYTKEDAPYIKVADPFYRQHDARLRPGWSTCSGGRGQVTLFDDHSYVAGSARGVVFDVVVGADGGSSGDCGTGVSAAPGATVAWQYEGAGASPNRGSFRISADGSRVIGWGTPAKPPLVFTEVDDKGRDLLDFYFAGSDVSYRAIKVPLTAFDLSVLRTTAGAHD